MSTKKEILCQTMSSKIIKSTLADNVQQNFKIFSAGQCLVKGSLLDSVLQNLICRTMSDKKFVQDSVQKKFKLCNKNFKFVQDSV